MWEEHAAIMSAISAHRVGLARALARVHVERVRDVVVAYLVSAGDSNNTSPTLPASRAVTHTNKKRRPQKRRAVLRPQTAAQTGARSIQKGDGGGRSRRIGCAFECGAASRVEESKRR